MVGTIGSGAGTVTFERDLGNHDARAQYATLPLYARDWRSAMHQTSK